MSSSINSTDIGSPGDGSSVAAVILAGGRATRMGGADKPLLPLGGRPLLDHILDRLRPQVGAVAINANGDPARYAAWGLPVLADPWPDQPGPLAGVLAGLLWAAPFASHVLSWPGDTPAPPHDLVARLRHAAAGIVCAASGGVLYPVAALWPVALIASLTEALRENRHRVVTFARSHGLTVVEWSDPEAFRNLNTPADWAAAEAGYGRPSTLPLREGEGGEWNAPPTLARRDGLP